MDFCDMNNKAFGLYTEQAVEAGDFDFNQTWKKYKEFKCHPNYGEKLLKQRLRTRKRNRITHKQGSILQN